MTRTRKPTGHISVYGQVTEDTIKLQTNVINNATVYVAPYGSGEASLADPGNGFPRRIGGELLRASAYSRAYALVTRLVGGSRTPYDFVIAVDAYHAWDPDQALAFIARGGDLLWVEDATPYEVLDGIAGAPAPVAAGESLETIDALIELRERAGVDYVLLDVQRLGGPSRFLAAAHALAARGARIRSHVYTPQSAHLMACVADPLPVEVFDWSDPLFTRPLRPDAGGRVPVEGPGFGVTLDRGALERHGELVVATPGGS